MSFIQCFWLRSPVVQKTKYPNCQKTVKLSLHPSTIEVYHRHNVVFTMLLVKEPRRSENRIPKLPKNGIPLSQHPFTIEVHHRHNVVYTMLLVKEPRRSENRIAKLPKKGIPLSQHPSMWSKSPKSGISPSYHPSTIEVHHRHSRGPPTRRWCAIESNRTALQREAALFVPGHECNSPVAPCHLDRLI